MDDRNMHTMKLSPNRRSSQKTLSDFPEANGIEVNMATLKLVPNRFSTFQDEKEYDPYRVVLDPVDHPKTFPLWKKWFIIAFVMNGALCVNAASSMPAFIELEIMFQFHVTQITSMLGVSLFVLGLAFGPLVIGPFSEVLGVFSTFNCGRSLLL
jgi:hypothetical protein